MRTLGIVLASLLVLIQYPLWLGKGGWLRVWELDRQLHAQEEVNARLASRNGALQAEVDDLRAGKQALEERARYELGMVKPGEIFVQINEADARRPVAEEHIHTAAVGTTTHR
ncbi:MAG TPA: cell division protein FtsB [Burkholderiaceae bacterium]|jgi:cell division protein FtsB|nr:cell division protein FtsB [Burkholderiaceae bacterium]